MGQTFEIFPTKIYSDFLDRRITDEELGEVIKLGEETHNNFGNLISDNQNILDNEKFIDIKNFIQSSLNEYIQKNIQPKNEVSIYITQSWLNYSRTNEFHHLHYHKNSYLSGVFYFNTVENDKIMLVDSQPKYCLEIESEYSIDHWNFPVKHGQLVLFPSFLYHKVEKNSGEETRVSLSFNTFINGDINNHNTLKIKL
tara:strand:- start:2443 stop:3036 length:594 start_codon:yes stop_codon:yes gene_type:complete